MTWSTMGTWSPTCGSRTLFPQLANNHLPHRRRNKPISLEATLLLAPHKPGAPYADFACGVFESSSGRGFSHDAVRANATGIQIRLRISRISSSSRKQLWVGHVFFRFGASGLQELVEAEARHSCLVQEPFDLLAKDRQLGLDDVPHRGAHQYPHSRESGCCGRQ